jgi:hypothetical protein
MCDWDLDEDEIQPPKDAKRLRPLDRQLSRMIVDIFSVAYAPYGVQLPKDFPDNPKKGDERESDPCT